MQHSSFLQNLDASSMCVLLYLPRQWCSADWQRLSNPAKQKSLELGHPARCRYYCSTRCYCHFKPHLPPELECPQPYRHLRGKWTIQCMMRNQLPTPG